MMVSTVFTVATKGEPVNAESVGGHPCKVVEFFHPDALTADDSDLWDGDFLTMDVPEEMWIQMGSPTEITVSIAPGNLLMEETEL